MGHVPLIWPVSCPVFLSIFINNTIALRNFKACCIQQNCPVLWPNGLPLVFSAFEPPNRPRQRPWMHTIVFFHIRAQLAAVKPLYSVPDLPLREFGRPNLFRRSEARTR